MSSRSQSDRTETDGQPGAAMTLVLVALLIAAAGTFLAYSLGGILLGAGLALAGRHD